MASQFNLTPGNPLLASIDALVIALEVRDAYTRSHCDRAVRLATELGEACGVTAKERNLLRVGAQFHDIGKIGVSDAVLLKPASLTQVEREFMQAHSELGERIFRATSIEDHEAVARVIRHHHEAFDGGGYPDGLCGDQIPLLSRILLVVDSYDAMSTARPYHHARSHREIMAILDSENGSKVDPEIYRTFSRLIERSPCRVQ